MTQIHADSVFFQSTEFEIIDFVLTMKSVRKSTLVAFVIASIVAYIYFITTSLRFEKTHAPIQFEKAESEYLRALSLYQEAVDKKDRHLLTAAIDISNNTKIGDQLLAKKFKDLRSKIYYAIDTLNGIIYLDAQNTIAMRLETDKGDDLIAPVDFSLFQNKIFIIDSGRLYEGNLFDLLFNHKTLYLTKILTPGYCIDGYPVQKIVAVDSAATNNLLYVLDQSGNVYRYDIEGKEWQIVKLESSKYKKPDPLYLNICTYKNRLYLIDPARNQIWRHPSSESGIGVLKSKLPWLLKQGDPDISGGIDLSVDGKVYVLFRSGKISIFSNEGIISFNLGATYKPIHVEGFIDLHTKPSAIFTHADSIILYIADAGCRSIFAVDKRNNKLLNHFVAPDNLDFNNLRSMVENEGYLYMLAGNKLYGYNYRGNSAKMPDLTGRLPILKSEPEYSISPSDLSPNDPRLPSILKKYGFKLPIKNAMLPDRSAVYPGSRRAYRYGVHEGIDLATKDIGVKVEMGSPVYAAGEGIVVRADSEYKEITLKEVTTLIDLSKVHHITSLKALEKLGGRQIWIDHGHNVVTVYKHLNSIAEGIWPGRIVESGQLIGYVGLSGTPMGIRGSKYFPHLHFEIRTGLEHKHYLGQWLTIEATRRAFEHIFSDVHVRPAYSDFRGDYTTEN